MRPPHGRKREITHEPQSAYDHRIHRPKTPRPSNSPTALPPPNSPSRPRGPWKDFKGDWKEKTQWHNVLAFGQGFAHLTSRLVKGTHVLVQGELTTREYDRAITVPNGKKSIEHIIQQLAVELKADTIRILDRSGNSEPSETTQAVKDDVPL